MIVYKNVLNILIAELTIIVLDTEPCILNLRIGWLLVVKEVQLSGAGTYLGIINVKQYHPACGIVGAKYKQIEEQIEETNRGWAVPSSGIDRLS